LGTLSLLWGRVLPQTRKPYSKFRVTRLGSGFRSHLLIHCLMYRENDCLLCYYGCLRETNADVENEMIQNAELVYITWLKLTSTSRAQSRLFHTMHSSLIRRQLCGLVPPKIATLAHLVSYHFKCNRMIDKLPFFPNFFFSILSSRVVLKSLSAGGSGEGLSPLVSFYSKPPKEPAPASGFETSKPASSRGRVRNANRPGEFAQ